jgi:hypothetical protein
LCTEINGGVGSFARFADSEYEGRFKDCCCNDESVSEWMWGGRLLVRLRDNEDMGGVEMAGDWSCKDSGDSIEATEK